MWNFNRIDGGGGVSIFHKTFIVFIVEFAFRTATTVHGINHHEYLAQLKTPQCRQDCMDKFNAHDLACLQKLDCSICNFPPYQFHSLPDAINLMCWNSCSPKTTETSTDSVIDSTSSTTWTASDTIQLDVHSMFRDGSLVMADIVWDLKFKPIQCLVTWEVHGGGITGNLLTDTAEAQLSLWPDSKYHLQVTCKNKENNRMSKSLPLLIDTANAITHTSSTHKMSESTPFTETPHLLHRPTGTDSSDVATNNGNNHENRRNEKPEFTVSQQHQTQHQRQQQYQTTTPFRHEQNEVHNSDNVIDDNDFDVGVTSNERDAHNDDDNDVMSPALAQPQIQAATRKVAAAVATAAKPTKTKPWKIKHILIETSLTALCVFFLIIALVICTVFSWKQTTNRTSTATSSNHYCDKSNLISRSSECEMDFNSSTTSIVSQSTVMHV